MVVLIVIAAFAIMAVAAVAGTGRLGEWKEPVTDAPKGHLPEGPVRPEFFEELVTPRAPFGYSLREVDEVYDALASGAHLADPPEFSIVRAGYRMAFVDEVLRRAVRQHEEAPAWPAPTDPDEIEEPAEADVDEENEPDRAAADRTDDDVEPVPARRAEEKTEGSDERP